VSENLLKSSAFNADGTDLKDPIDKGMHLWSSKDVKNSLDNDKVPRFD